MHSSEIYSKWTSAHFEAGTNHKWSVLPVISDVVLTFVASIALWPERCHKKLQAWQQKLGAKHTLFETNMQIRCDDVFYSYFRILQVKWTEDIILIYLTKYTHFNY